MKLLDKVRKVLAKQRGDCLGLMVDPELDRVQREQEERIQFLKQDILRRLTEINDTLVQVAERMEALSERLKPK